MIFFYLFIVIITGVFQPVKNAPKYYRETYLNKLGNKAEQLIETMGKEQDVTFTYQYRQERSNDGAYWLTDLKVNIE